MALCHRVLPWLEIYGKQNSSNLLQTRLRKNYSIVRTSPMIFIMALLVK